MADIGRSSQEMIKSGLINAVREPTLAPFSLRSILGFVPFRFRSRTVSSGTKRKRSHRRTIVRRSSNVNFLLTGTVVYLPKVDVEPYQTPCESRRKQLPPLFPFPTAGTSLGWWTTMQQQWMSLPLPSSRAFSSSCIINEPLILVCYKLGKLRKCLTELWTKQLRSIKTLRFVFVQ